jgi:hypothetical protein
MLRRELSKELWEAMPMGGCGMSGVAGSPGDEPTRECFTGLVNGMDGIGFWRVRVHREQSSWLAASSKACARCCVPVSCLVYTRIARVSPVHWPARVCPPFTLHSTCPRHVSPVHITTRMRPWFTLPTCPRHGACRSLPRTFGTTQRSTSACQTSRRRLPDCSFAQICRERH